MGRYKYYVTPRQGCPLRSDPQFRSRQVAEDFAGHVGDLFARYGQQAWIAGHPLHVIEVEVDEKDWATRERILAQECPDTYPFGATRRNATDRPAFDKPAPQA